MQHMQVLSLTLLSSEALFSVSGSPPIARRRLHYLSDLHLDLHLPLTSLIAGDLGPTHLNHPLKGTSITYILCIGSMFIVIKKSNDD